MSPLATLAAEPAPTKTPLWQRILAYSPPMKIIGVLSMVTAIVAMSHYRDTLAAGFVVAAPLWFILDEMRAKRTVLLIEPGHESPRSAARP